MYCTLADVQLHAPQITSAVATEIGGEDGVDGYITQADGVIDARLRSVFEVPFATPDQLIVNISSKLAAGYVLNAYYSQMGSGEPSKHAATLIREAMDGIAEIIADPTLLSQDLRPSPSADSEAKSGIAVCEGSSFFSMEGHGFK